MNDKDWDAWVKLLKTPLWGQRNEQPLPLLLISPGGRLLADSYEVKGDQYVAIITDPRDDIPLRRVHIENGRRFPVPNTKIKWDRGNPTGHGIIFIGYGEDVLCYVPPGGG